MTLRAATATEKLSDAQVDPLREVDEQYGHTREECQLVELLRGNPQSWKDREGLSIASEYRDTLRANGKAEIEVEAIRNEHDPMAHVVGEHLSEETVQR